MILSNNSSLVNDNSSPVVSVILPVFNAGKTVDRAIKSLLDQTYTDFELVVVNDGSTDNTENVVKKFKDIRIRYYKLSHGGIAKALNFGMKMSRGKFIARMDADDYSYPDRFHNQVAYLKQHRNIGLVSCLVEYEGNRKENEGYVLYVDWLNEIRSSEDVFRKRFQESPIAHPTVMFRRELAGMYGGYSEENTPEDYELWLRWIDSGTQMAKVPQILYQWKDHPNRLSRTHYHYDSYNFYKLKAKYLSSYFNTLYSESKPLEIWVWGTGKSVRKRTAYLADYSIDISRYIEVKPPPYQNRTIVYYQNLPNPSDLIILSYVSDRKGKREIQQYLNELGYKEGINYFMMS